MSAVETGQMSTALFRLFFYFPKFCFEAIHASSTFLLLGGLRVPFVARSGPRGEKMAAACRGVDSQVLATILDPFRIIFADLGPDRLSAT